MPVIAVLTLGVLTACEAPAPVEVYTPEGEVRMPDEPAETEELPMVQAGGLNIGDLEQTVHLNIVLSERSQATNIRVQELTDRLDRVQLLTVLVAPPYPESLWLQPVVDSNNDFSEQPAIFRGVYRRNNVALDSFAQVLSERRRNEYPMPPIDVLAGLSGVPDGLLLEVDLEGVLFPRGYDPAAIADPAEATSDAVTTALYATTVRVEFLGRDDGGAAGTEPEPAGETPESPDADGAAGEQPDPAGEPAR
jgi:hypothetical protein